MFRGALLFKGFCGTMAQSKKEMVIVETIRVGIVGLGHRGRAIAKLAASFPGVALIAACDVRSQNWYQTQWRSEQAMADVFPQAAFFESYEQMLKEVPLDLVIVETGADIHCDFCCKALERNIHVFAEIPLIATLQEAERIWKTAGNSSAVISVGANPNYQRFAEMLVEFHEKGFLGKPYCMEAEYIHPLDPDGEGAHLYENGGWRRLLAPIRYCTHSLGPLQRILKQELRYVSCFGTGSHAPEDRDRYVEDDMQCAQFQTEDGAVVRLLRNGRCRARIGHHSYRVFGTEGYMERMDRMGKPVIRYNSARDQENVLKEVDGRFMPRAYESIPEAAAGHGGMDYAMLEDFFRCLGQGKPAVSVKEGLAMTLPGIYAEESARRKGRVIRIQYPWDSDWSCEFQEA